MNTTNRERENAMQPKAQNAPGWMVAGMGSCFALGTFTDNFFKQCAVLLAASAGLTSMQSIAAVLFSLPYILFSAWAGWFADRLVKKHLVFGAKVVEFLALLLGGYSLVTLYWPGILGSVFLMGIQATVFSPAINGAIPETFPTEMVPRVNSYIKLATTITTLAGMAAAGFFLDLRPGTLFRDFSGPEGQFGRYACAAVILAVAGLGILAACTLKRHNPQGSLRHGAFPWAGPKMSVLQFLETKEDPALFMILLAEGFFYGVAAIAVICVANLSEELGFSKTAASLFSPCIMTGIAVGAVIAGRFDAWSWRRLLVPAALGMGGGMLLVACTGLVPATGLSGGLSLQKLWFALTLFGTGMCGGIYLIPVASFIQVRPAKDEKGKVLGISNFFTFVAVALFGVVFYPVSLLPAAWTFIVFGLFLCLFAALYLRPTIRRLEC